MTANWKNDILNYSIRKINELNETSLTYQIRRGFLLIPMVFWGAAATRELQEDALEKIGFKREHAKYFTLANAIIGFGTAAAWYYGGRESSEMIENLPRFLGAAVNVANYGYNVGWNCLQNGRRIVNVLRTGDAQVSLSITGLKSSAVLTGIKKTSSSLEKSRLEKIAQEIG
jgi:hypothetical protein